jgi:hypothetical protein
MTIGFRDIRLIFILPFEEIITRDDTSRPQARKATLPLQAGDYWKNCYVPD